MLSRRKFIAGLLALPIVAKIAPAAPVAKKRRLKATWTAESAEDLRNMHGMGATESAFMDAGYVWAPYIPLVVTSTLLDPSDFPTQAMSRYSKKVVRTDYYGTVKVENLNAS